MGLGIKSTRQKRPLNYKENRQKKKNPIRPREAKRRKLSAEMYEEETEGSFVWGCKSRLRVQVYFF